MVEVGTSSAKQPMTRVQLQRFKTRRRHVDLVPRGVLTAGLFVLTAALVQTGAVDWMSRDIKENRNEMSYPVALAEGADFGDHRRQLQTFNLATFNYSMYQCASGGPACPSGNLFDKFPGWGFNSNFLIGCNDKYDPTKPDQKVQATIFIFVVVFWMFQGLAIVCDAFFEASLEAICEKQGLKDDVAGATWMAAGGSAPELSTSIIGVFFSKSDVGFGTIVGSAVFNVLFVIACCAFVAPNLTLTWWPLARDCSYYCLSLAMIVIFVSDDLQVAAWEAITLFFMYCIYVTIMAYNESLEAFVTNHVKKSEENQTPMQKAFIKIFENPIFAVVLYAVILANSVIVILEIVDYNAQAALHPCVCGVQFGAANMVRSAAGSLYQVLNNVFNVIFIVEMFAKFYAYGVFGYWKIPLNCFDGALVFLIFIEMIIVQSSQANTSDFAESEQLGVGVARIFRLLKFVRFIRAMRLLRLIKFMRLFNPEGAHSTASTATVTPEGEGAPTKKEGVEIEAAAAKDVEGGGEGGEEEEEEDDDGPFDPCEIPDSVLGKVLWFIGLPLSVAFYITIPDCRSEKGIWAKILPNHYYLVHFFMCISWIAILAFFMVWVVDRFGKIYGVPDAIMGVTLLAAGTSIPDALSSVAVARRGHGDMAVSSSIGSNIFDVLIGLPVPWMMYTVILRPIVGESIGPQWVPVQSEGLALMILTLFVMVALVITTIHLSGWALSVRLGIMMMLLYFGFLVIAFLLIYQLVFPPCDAPAV